MCFPNDADAWRALLHALRCLHLSDFLLVIRITCDYDTLVDARVSSIPRVSQALFDRPGKLYGDRVARCVLCRIEHDQAPARMIYDRKRAS